MNCWFNPFCLCSLWEPDRGCVFYCSFDIGTDMGLVCLFKCEIEDVLPSLRCRSISPKDDLIALSVSLVMNRYLSNLETRESQHA